MPLTPTEYVDCFLPVSISTLEWDGSQVIDGQPESVYVSQYVNFGIKEKFNANSESIKDQLISFLREKTKQKTSGISASIFGAKSAIDLPEVNPAIWGFPYATLMGAITGKVTADEIMTVLRLVSLWMSTKPKALRSVATLQKFADLYCGLDCNGYTGAFFKSQYPYTGLQPNTHISQYETKGKKRKSLEEICDADVLVFPNHAHIALVDAVQAPANGKLNVTVCQSRSYGLGGVHAAPGVLTLNKSKQFEINGRAVRVVVGII